MFALDEKARQNYLTVKKINEKNQASISNKTRKVRQQYINTSKLNKWLQLYFAQITTWIYEFSQPKQ